MTLTDTTILGQSGPGNNGSEWALHIYENSRTGVSSLDSLISYSDTH